MTSVDFAFLHWKELLRENITRHYMSTNEDAYDEINAEVQVLASKLSIADRTNMTAKRQAFITLKDHKKNFENNLPCRLINAAKSEMGLVRKQIPDIIHGRLKEKPNVTL